MFEINFTRFKVPMPMFRLVGGERLSVYTYEDGILTKGDFKSNRLHTAENTVQLVLSGRDCNTEDYVCYLDGIYSVVSAEHFTEWLQTYEHTPFARKNIEATLLKLQETGCRVPVFLMRNLYVVPEYRLLGIGHAMASNLPTIMKDVMKFKGVILIPDATPREYSFGHNRQDIKTSKQNPKEQDNRLAEMRLTRFLNAAGYNQLSGSTTWWYQVT